MVYVGYYNLANKLHCFRECKSQQEADIFINRNNDSNKLIIARVLSNKEKGLIGKWLIESASIIQWFNIKLSCDC